MPGEVAKIQLLGRSHIVDLPRSILQREELFSEWMKVRERGGRKALRVACALLGACTRIGRLAKVSYEEADCSPVVYGGRVYDWIRTGHDASWAEGLGEAVRIIEGELSASLAALEVAAKRADFSGPVGEPSTDT